MKRVLPKGLAFKDFIFLEMNEQGMYIERVAEVADYIREITPNRLPSYLDSYIILPDEVTDVFVWVHGWNNDSTFAITSARRLFNGIVHVWETQGKRYKDIQKFVPAFIAIHWPSSGHYATMRDRAHAMTENGCAEYVLASLLGYLDSHRSASPATAAGIMQSRAGFYVHCIGHSFGGRFLSQAIMAAAEPSHEALELLEQTPEDGGTLSFIRGADAFDFTVDSLLVYQMAAPSEIFSDRFRALLTKAPLRGPICLTYSEHDRANCLWHKTAEGRSAVGCVGATAPKGMMQSIKLKNLDEDYTYSDFFSQSILNINASWAYKGGTFSMGGAHSDFWYEESIHLLLSMVDAAR